jgi:hypothetical protein
MTGQARVDSFAQKLGFELRVIDAATPATRVNAEQASHDGVQVKGPHQGSIDKPPVAFGIPGLSPI